VFGGGFISLLLALLHHCFLRFLLGFLGLFALLCHDDLPGIVLRVSMSRSIPVNSIACDDVVGNVRESLLHLPACVVVRLGLG
jgi:hypothetical protein